MDFEKLQNKWLDIQEGVLNEAPKFILAIVLLAVGFWIIKKLVKFLVRFMNARKMNPTLIPFITGFLNAALKLFLILTIVETLGIKTTSFVAIIGAMGLAVGFALQGSLANFAGGVLILIFKQFKVGDLVESQDKIGIVKEIQIFNTILVSADNKRIILPNANVSNGTLINYTAEGKLRLEIAVGIAYHENIKIARDVILAEVNLLPNVLKSPEATVSVTELGDSSVNLVVRPYCKPEYYFDTELKVIEAIKTALDNKGIEIPFPQQVSYEYKMGTKE